MAGYTCVEMRREGWTLEQIRAAGYTCVEAKEASYSLAQLRAAGYELVAMREAGFTLAEMGEAGFTLADMGLPASLPTFSRAAAPVASGSATSQPRAYSTPAHCPRPRRSTLCPWETWGFQYDCLGVLYFVSYGLPTNGFHSNLRGPRETRRLAARQK